MSDGLYEVFAKRNTKKAPKTVEINKHVHIKIFKDKVFIINELSGDSIALKKTTVKKISEKLK